MTSEATGRKRWSASRKRILVYLTLFALFLAWDTWRRHWSPTFYLETPHYQINSSATPDQTREIGALTEALLAAYTNFFSTALPTNVSLPHLKMRLYKDREEFRRCHRFLGWAEAFYQTPYCNAYFSTNEINSTHWMLHEATHQLNSEVAGLRLAQWLEEGLATYFSTSLFINQRLMPGRIDPNTYPVWWLDEIGESGDLQADLRGGSIIPLRAIITGKGGPRMKTHFNLYYLHWWSLTHFLLQYEGGKYREQTLELAKEGGNLESFERLIGPADRVQKEWYEHVQKLKRIFATSTPLKPGDRPE